MSKRYVTIRLKGQYAETGPLVSGLSATARKSLFRLDELLQTVEWILKRSRVTTVIVHRTEEFTGASLAGYESIRRLIMKLRDADRDVIYYAVNYGLEDLFLASVCTRRVIHPLGSISFYGKALNKLYFGRLLSKQSVGVDIIRHGRYKSAMSTLSSDRVDRYDREQLERVLRVMVERVRTLITSDMMLSDTALESMLNGEPVRAADALERGWVERVDDIQGVLETLSDLRSAKVGKPKARLGRSGPNVSVLFFDGAIDHGSNRKSILLGQIMGSDWYVKQLRKIRKSKKIKAVVLRVNSPGGSATASEEIRREIDRIRETKPVIVSMGQVAASGGYWISAKADRVFAQKFTITGSIGVISALFYLRDFLKKHGITASVVKYGDHADLGSTLRKMSIEERRIFEQEVRHIYDQFLELVAEGRKLDHEAVSNIAEGRIWSGEDAMQNGLIDEIGDLHSALDYAAAVLGVSSIEAHFGPRVRRPLVTRLIGDGAGDHRDAATPGLRLIKQLKTGLAGGQYKNDVPGIFTAVSGFAQMDSVGIAGELARELSDLSARPLAFWDGWLDSETPNDVHSTISDPLGSS